MKKIIALALAASMLSTSAFAATIKVGKNEKTIDELKVAGTNAHNLSGAKVFFDTDDFVPVKGGVSSLTGTGIQDYQFNSDNFSVRYKVSKGSSLVKRPVFQDGKLVVEFNEGATKASDKLSTNVPDVVFDEIVVRAKRDVKDVEGNLKVKAGTEYKIDIKNSDLKTTNAQFIIVQKQALADEKITDLNSLTDLKGQKIIKDGDTYRVDLYATSNGIEVNGRVYANEAPKFEFSSVDADAISNLYRANLDAEFEATKIVAENFSAPLTVKMYLNAIGDVESQDQILYFFDEKTGKLENANLKYNADENVWEGRISATTVIVNSTSKLNNAPAASSNEDKKPADSKKPAVPETGLVVNVDAAIVK